VVASYFKELRDCGVDYVTTTCKERGNWTKFREFAERYICEEHDSGFDVKQWEAWGYSGLSSGHAQFGERWDNLLLRISGPTAQTRIGEFYGLTTNVSRLDCQSTAALINPDFLLAERVERQARKHAKITHAKWAVRLLRDSKSGNTVYFGRRVSDRFLRVYDKVRESGDPDLAGCWRAEVQFNHNLAFHIAMQLASNQFSRQQISHLVKLEMARKGVPWPDVQKGTLSAHWGPAPKMRSDRARRLEWLKSQVRPTIEELVDAGFRRDVLKALGLEEGGC
jgi:replication initiation factor